MVSVPTIGRTVLQMTERKHLETTGLNRLPERRGLIETIRQPLMDDRSLNEGP